MRYPLFLKHTIARVLLGATLAASLPAAQASTVWAEFIPPLDTRNGATVLSIASSNISGDVVAEPLTVESDMVNVKGTIKRSPGSYYGVLGMDVSPAEGVDSVNLVGNDTLRIRLVASQDTVLRLRLKGPDLDTQKNGCYPVILVQAGTQIKEYLVSVDAFEPEAYCDARGVSIQDTLKSVTKVEITAIQPSETPIDFSVGRIIFENSKSPTALTGRAPAAAATGKWNLVWADEFDSAASTPADTAKWQYVVGDKENFGNEQQYYRNLPRDAATDGQGMLAIWPRTNDDAKLLCNGQPCAYTSAKLRLTPQYATFYGRIEARFKLPAGKGMHGSFTLTGQPLSNLPWPEVGELELLRASGKGYGTGVYSKANELGDITGHALADPNAFHTLVFEWSPQKLSWSLDGIEVASRPTGTLDAELSKALETWPFALSMGVGVDKEVKPNAPASEPMLVDYVRVYQREDLVASTQAKFKEWYSARSSSPASSPTKVTAISKRPTAPAVEPRPAPRPVARPKAPEAVTPETKLLCNRNNPLGLMLCYSP
jgi:beta-glucanase (GH16 family)